MYLVAWSVALLLIVNVLVTAFLWVLRDTEK
jgi:hypothetical protein